MISLLSIISSAGCFAIDWPAVCNYVDRGHVTKDINPFVLLLNYVDFSYTYVLQ